MTYAPLCELTRGRAPIDLYRHDRCQHARGHDRGRRWPGGRLAAGGVGRRRGDRGARTDSPLALARRQGGSRDEVPPTLWQWSLFVAVWAGTAVWFITASWYTRLALTDHGVSQTLDSFFSFGWIVAAACWLVLVLHLWTQIGRRVPGRISSSATTGPRSRWATLAFIAMIPGNLAMAVWASSGGGLVSGKSGWDGLALTLTAGPVLLVLLAVSTTEAARTAWAARGVLLTTRQACLQVGMWVSLAAVGAGVTLMSSEDETYSAVLTLLPGAVGLSKTIAWIGVAGFLVTYVLLLISFRSRHARAREAAWDRLVAHHPVADADPGHGTHASPGSSVKLPLTPSTSNLSDGTGADPARHGDGLIK